MFQITCLNLISSKKSNLTSLSGIIKMMSGVLAVGMEEGIVCVLDLKSFDLISGKCKLRLINIYFVKYKHI